MIRAGLVPPALRGPAPRPGTTPAAATQPLSGYVWLIAAEAPTTKAKKP